jgi:hypothetical protein
MRYSKVEKAKTHKRIVAIASRRFRGEGLAGIGIAAPSTTLAPCADRNDYNIRKALAGST